MKISCSNGIALEADCFGDSTAPAILLLHGLGAQLTMWREALFCAPLAARGHFVIRYDSRDAGRSQSFDHFGDQDIAQRLEMAAKGAPLPPLPYAASDLARDACGLLDAMGVASAHVVGFALGGAVAQLMAIDHPDRVRALTLIASTSHHPKAASPLPHVVEQLFARPADFYDKAQVVSKRLVLQDLLAGAIFRDEREIVRARLEHDFDRSHNPAANHRLAAALIFAGDRTSRLATLDTPALVIHGEDDGLALIENGRQLASAIPGAQFLPVQGMGHALTDGLWPYLVQTISDFDCAARAQRERPCA